MRGKRVSVPGLLLLFVVVCLALPMTATASLGRVYIGGGRIVFVQSRYVDDQQRDTVYTWKAGETSPIAIAPADAGGYYSVTSSPRAEGDQVVWAGWRHTSTDTRGSEQVWLWAPSALTALTAANPFVPRIGVGLSGDRIVWRANMFEPGYRTSEQIETLKLGDAAPLRITSNSNLRAAVRMAGDRIVWREFLPGGDWQVLTWKAGDNQPTQLTSGSHFHGAARVSADRVIWYENKDTGRELYTWKPGDTEPRLLATSANSWWGRRIGGRLSGDRVLWREKETHDDAWQLFMWKAGDTNPTQVTNDANDHAFARISGDRLVWVTYPNEQGAWYRPTHNVYTWKIGDAKPTKITPSEIRCSYLSVSGDQVVWVEAKRVDEDWTQALMTWRPGQSEPTLLMKDVY